MSVSLFQLFLFFDHLNLLLGKKDGLLQLLLAVCLLFIGGGVGPPTLGILPGFAGLGNNAKYSFWNKIFKSKFRYFLAGHWLWIFYITALNDIFLVISRIILVFIFGYTNAEVFLYNFFFAFFSILINIFIGIAYDLKNLSS